MREGASVRCKHVSCFMFLLVPSLSLIPAGLLPASLKLREGGGGGEDGVHMFKTGSGRSVTVRPSSLRKAEMVIGESDKSGGEARLCACFFPQNLSR